MKCSLQTAMSQYKTFIWKTMVITPTPYYELHFACRIEDLLAAESSTQGGLIMHNARLSSQVNHLYETLNEDLKCCKSICHIAFIYLTSTHDSNI